MKKEVLMICVVLLVCLASGSIGAEKKTIRIEGAKQLCRGNLAGTELTKEGLITLKQAGVSSVDSKPIYSTFGTYTYEIALPVNSSVLQIAALAPEMPSQEKSPFKWSNWPCVTTDIITQVCFLQPNGEWTVWQPHNLLAGGDFNDKNQNGIPDWTNVFLQRSGHNSIFVDRSIIGWQPPENSWYCNNDMPLTGKFMDTIGLPIDASQSFRLERHTHDGQDVAEMCKDLVPPNATLTVSGWNCYDIEPKASMGVMARFHEYDAEGRRINKYVLLGDDDFHQPSGHSLWQWRALTFTTLPTTARLGIYPIRMITAQGQAWAANWEVREGAVYSEWGSSEAIFKEEFLHLDNWKLSHPAVSALKPSGYSGSHSLVMEPPPLVVATAVQKDFIQVQEGKLYAFRIAMQNDASEKYELTHETWVSCYFEFFDENKHFLDYVKAMAFRPSLERPIGAAMVAPPGSRFARFLLVASHIIYGDRKKITERMSASFSALQLEESAYNMTWTPRPAGAVIEFQMPVRATRMKIKSLLLSRDRLVSPSFSGYSILVF